MELQNLNHNRQDVFVATKENVETMEPVSKNCGRLITEFGETTTLHGLPRIIIAKSLLGKLIWSAVFVVALCAFIYQGFELVKLYVQFDVRVNIEVGTAPFLPFPAVTLCNTNKLRLSEIEKSEHGLLARTDPEHEDTIHRLLSYEKYDNCLPGDFECRDGVRCIKPHLRCDGYYHCWDGLSDELNCTYPKCGTQQFDCKRAGPHGVCINEDKLCDGVHHCQGGEDEMNCPVCSGGTACDFGLETSGYKCIPDINLCDRFPDCIDGTDEESCSNVNHCANAYLETSQSSRVLYSPNYPSDYDSDIQCQITVTTPPWTYDGLCILLSFLELDIEPSENCTNDYIQFEDPYNPMITTRSCGSRLPTSWMSSSNEALITFVSNAKSTGRGYRIQYSEFPCPSKSTYWEKSPWIECSATCGGGIHFRAVTPKGCEDVPPDSCIIAGTLPTSEETCNMQYCPGVDYCGRTLNDCCKEITSPDYPQEYPPNKDCSMTIVNEEGGCIDIMFEEFDIVDSYECHKDYLEYGDVPVSRDDSMQRLCGEQSGFRWISATSEVYLLFHSDMVVSKKGYRATYDFVPCGTWQLSPWGMCSVACGFGMRFRRVVCWSRNKKMKIDDRFCQGRKPNTEEHCTEGMCGMPIDGEMPQSMSLLDRFRHISDDPQLYDEFITSYYKKYGFERVLTESPPDWQGFLTFSSSPDYSDLRNVLKLSKEELAKYGHQAEDMILQCSFEDIACNASDFYVFQNDNYGNCFTFNSWQLTGHSRRSSMRPGSKYGLKLTLFIEQDEYIPLYGQEAGVRVLIHQPDIIPFPEDEAITVAPGLKTSIGLRRDMVQSPDAPYTNCTNHKKFSSIFGNGYNYSDLACHKSKVHEYILRECGCVDTIYVEGPMCQILYEDEEMCRQLMQFFYQRGLLSSDCKEPCKDVQYSKTLSQAQWPSNKHVGGVQKVIRAFNDKVRNAVVDKESLRDNLLRLEVYYDELNYQKITKVPAYLIEELLGDIGGLLGLYIGLSLITVVEFLELFVTAFRYLIKKIRLARK
ncbi:uncharacterized protein LOC144437595 [Glandiceps talaboti]